MQLRVNVVHMIHPQLRIACGILFLLFLVALTILQRMNVVHAHDHPLLRIDLLVFWVALTILLRVKVMCIIIHLLRIACGTGLLVFSVALTTVLRVKVVHTFT